MKSGVKYEIGQVHVRTLQPYCIHDCNFVSKPVTGPVKASTIQMLQGLFTLNFATSKTVGLATWKRWSRSMWIPRTLPSPAGQQKVREHGSGALRKWQTKLRKWCKLRKRKKKGKAKRGKGKWRKERKGKRRGRGKEKERRRGLNKYSKKM